MSIRTRIKLLTSCRLILILCFGLVMGLSISAYAGVVQQEAQLVDLMWKFIAGLMSVLCTISIGVQVWLISNQSELFRRTSAVEADVKAHREGCDVTHKRF